MEKEFFPMTTTFDRAKTLLDGSPCYALADVERIFGVTYAKEKRTVLENIPFSEKVLKTCARTHMLFPGFPLTLLSIRAKYAHLFYAKTGGWYADQAFATEIQVSPTWHLLRMEPVPGSFSKTWDEQNQLLLPDEEVPSSALVVYATMLHFAATKKRLFQSCYVRMSDLDSGGRRVDVGLTESGVDSGGLVDSGGRRVLVGLFDDDGLHVYSGNGWDGNRYNDLGLSASRKF